MSTKHEYNGGAGNGKPAGEGPALTEREHALTLVQVRELLRQNIAQPATLEGIAARAKRSKFQLSRAFARAYGTSPMSYRTALRVEEAKRRLRAGAAIKVVAFDLGFIDASHFGRVFKRRVGVSPGVYKKCVAQPEVDAALATEAKSALAHQIRPLAMAAPANIQSPRS